MSATNERDNGIARQIASQIMVLNSLHNHDAVMRERGPARKEDEDAMLSRIAGGNQREYTERDVNGEDHLVLPIDR